MTALASAISIPTRGVSYHGGESLVSRLWSGISGVIKLDVSDEGRVTPEREIVLPAWIIPAFMQLYLLQRLPDDWDSYGGVALQVSHRDAALRFLGLAMADGVPLPDIVPLADGGVQLEWRSAGVEVDYISDNELSEPTVFITRDGEAEEIEETWAVSYRLDELRSMLRAPEAVAA